MTHSLTNADQIGIVVEDLDAYLDTLQKYFGLADFEIIEYPPEGVDPQTIYRGAKATFKVRTAFGKVGNLEFEIVQPLEGESVFSDSLAKRGPGLHHVRFTEENFDEICEELQEKGIPLIASGRGVHGSSTWAYFDTSELLDGLLIEIRKLRA